MNKHNFILRQVDHEIWEKVTQQVRKRKKIDTDIYYLIRKQIFGQIQGPIWDQILNQTLDQLNSS